MWGQVADYVYTPIKSFGKDSVRLVKRCTKPDRKGKLWCITERDAGLASFCGSQALPAARPSGHIPRVQAPRPLVQCHRKQISDVCELVITPERGFPRACDRRLLLNPTAVHPPLACRV